MTDTATPAPPPVAAPAPASPSPYTDAQGAIDQANAATLAQLAAGNLSGTNAGNAAVQAGQADKAAALQGLLRSAIMTGGPQAAPTTGGGPSQAAALQGIVGGAFDQRIGTTGDLTAPFNQANATREAGAGTYFKEAGAAVPVIQAQTAQRESILKAQAQQRALTGALSLARAQAELSRTTRLGSAANPTAAESLNKTTGGLTASQDVIDTLADQGGYDQLKAAAANNPGVTPFAPGQAPSVKLAALISSIAQQTGLDPIIVQSYLDAADVRETAASNAQISAGNAQAAAGRSAGAAVDQASVGAGVTSANGALTPGGTVAGQPTGPDLPFSVWWASFTAANPGLDAATLDAIRANAQPLFKKLYP